ncbi:nuclear transport factor 2 family protein [uncultured Rhodoblastus sp.]|uniref:nuclear transport factor 2 family protein n=1 Tax=uncultured Rhodoblastus sp. TaxID=543037 RepID=UPI0025FF9662|nr:nuclear transport factor 2 family protein [uncultured Rhodoblastus sp.]
MAIARDIYGRRAKGDNEPGLAFFHENARYRLLGSRALIPAAGLRVGKAEIREAWRAFDTDFEILSFEIEDLVIDMPRCSYMSWRMQLRGRGAGAIAELEGIDRLVWVDFKIVEWTRFFDTALVAALAENDREGGRD